MSARGCKGCHYGRQASRAEVEEFYRGNLRDGLAAGSPCVDDFEGDPETWDPGVPDDHVAKQRICHIDGDASLGDWSEDCPSYRTRLVVVH